MHTKGPWIIRPSNQGYASESYVIQAPNVQVCSRISKKRIADAHLIAAAPQMLESLKAVVRVIGDDSTFDHCRHAIAKAENK